MRLLVGIEYVGRSAASHLGELWFCRSLAEYEDGGAIPGHRVLAPHKYDFQTLLPPGSNPCRWRMAPIPPATKPEAIPRTSLSGLRANPSHSELAGAQSSA
jgi:hypothetical protein